MCIHIYLLVEVCMSMRPCVCRYAIQLHLKLNMHELCICIQTFICILLSVCVGKCLLHYECLCMSRCVCVCICVMFYWLQHLTCENGWKCVNYLLITFANLWLFCSITKRIKSLPLLHFTHLLPPSPHSKHAGMHLWVSVRVWWFCINAFHLWCMSV